MLDIGNKVKCPLCYMKEDSACSVIESHVEFEHGPNFVASMNLCLLCGLILKYCANSGKTLISNKQSPIIILLLKPDCSKPSMFFFSLARCISIND